jgi:hypothetical protein
VQGEAGDLGAERLAPARRADTAADPGDAPSSLGAGGDAIRRRGLVQERQRRRAVGRRHGRCVVPVLSFLGWQAQFADPALKTNTLRVAARETLIPQVAALLKTMSRDGIVALAERAGLPYAPIARPEDLFEDPHLNASGGLADTALPDGGRVKLPILPLDLDGHRLHKRLDPPRLGAHTDEVLAGLGYSPAEIDAMAVAGAIRRD